MAVGNKLTHTHTEGIFTNFEQSLLLLSLSLSRQVGRTAKSTGSIIGSTSTLPL